MLQTVRHMSAKLATHLKQKPSTGARNRDRKSAPSSFSYQDSDRLMRHHPPSIEYNDQIQVRHVFHWGSPSGTLLLIDPYL